MDYFHSFIWILWDLLAATIFFYHVRRCARRGFVSTIIGLFVYIAAVFAAHTLYIRFADFIYKNIIYDVVRRALSQGFGDMINGTGAAPDIVGAIPASLRLLLGIRSGEVAAIPVTEAADMAEKVIDIALKEPILSVLHGAGFLLIFTLTAYIVRHIASFFIGINRVPVIGVINMAAGGIAGVAEGLLTLFVSGFFLRMLIGISDGAWWWLNQDVIKSTYLWRMFV